MLRRPHRKSRLGCKNCKLRRKKCDEVHPICANCLKHGITCDFSPAQMPPTSQSLPPVQIPSLRKFTSGDDVSSITSLIPSIGAKSLAPGERGITITDDPPLSEFALVMKRILLAQPPLQPAIGTPADRLLDLKLFHHYAQMTIFAGRHFSYPLDSYDAVVGRQNVWAKWITTLAFRNQALMDAILGFAAFHLRGLNPSDREILRASHDYMGKALKGHSAQLRNGFDEDNSEAIFATSTIIASHACLSRKYLNDKMGPPVHWFQAYRGVRAVLETGWQWIKNSEIRPLIMNEMEFVSATFEYEESTSSVFGFLLKDLDLEKRDAETVECFNRAIGTLEWINNSGTPRHILRFSAMMSPRFVQMLSEEDPRTLTIVGYFFLMLKRVEAIWWLEGTVEGDFWALMRILPREWWPQMDWAVRVFQGKEDDPKVTGKTDSNRGTDYFGLPMYPLGR